MSNDNNSIHDFDYTLICEYFAGINRQGPGSPDITLKALSFIGQLTNYSKIADIGCGTGGQTMVLAQHTNCSIVGIDLFPYFIELFSENARKLNIQDRVKGVVGNMDELPFKINELDVIWCEGAIYNIGFERGLNEWHKFLKPGGYIAISEATWFTNERPEEIDLFWKREYPGIDTIPNKLAQMQNAGYIPVASFILPETCWTDNFYIPQSNTHEAFLKKYQGNVNAEALIENQKHEAFLYSKYKEFYGYTFFIGKKI